MAMLTLFRIATGDNWQGILKVSTHLLFFFNSSSIKIINKILKDFVVIIVVHKCYQCINTNKISSENK